MRASAIADGTTALEARMGGIDLWRTRTRRREIGASESEWAVGRTSGPVGSDGRGRTAAMNLTQALAPHIRSAARRSKWSRARLCRRAAEGARSGTAPGAPLGSRRAVARRTAAGQIRPACSGWASTRGAAHRQCCGGSRPGARPGAAGRPIPRTWRSEGGPGPPGSCRASISLWLRPLE